MVRIGPLESVDDSSVDHGDSLDGEWLQARCQTPLTASELEPDQGGGADVQPSASLGAAGRKTRSDYGSGSGRTGWGSRCLLESVEAGMDPVPGGCRGGPVACGVVRCSAGDGVTLASYTGLSTTG
jgi:hypothetical protein